MSILRACSHMGRMNTDTPWCLVPTLQIHGYDRDYRNMRPNTVCKSHFLWTMTESQGKGFKELFHYSQKVWFSSQTFRRTWIVTRRPIWRLVWPRGSHWKKRVRRLPVGSRGLGDLSLPSGLCLRVGKHLFIQMEKNTELFTYFLYSSLLMLCLHWWEQELMAYLLLGCLYWVAMWPAKAAFNKWKYRLFLPPFPTLVRSHMTHLV